MILVIFGLGFIYSYFNLFGIKNFVVVVVLNYDKYYFIIFFLLWPFMCIHELGAILRLSEIQVTL
jgi:hypothetical protein